MSTIAEMIARVDENKPNAFSEGVKMRWIAELDGKIAVDVFLMHHSETAQFNYKWPEDMNTQPLVPFPHDDIYLHWLEAKIDYANGEYNKYQNTMESYNEAYSNFVRWFARVYKPAKGGGTELRSDVTQYYITAFGLAVKQGYTGTLDAWLESLRGPKGDPGVSPYEFAVAGGFEGTEAEFLYKLLHDGKTAWEYAAEGGYKGTEAEFTQLMANAAHKDDIPKIDTTLTAEGQAADAAAVGAELAKKADAAAVDAALAKKTEYVLLWSNASRTSAFAAHTEDDVSTVGYDHLLVVCGYNTDLAYGQSVNHVWLRTETSGISRTYLSVERISNNSLVRSFREMSVPRERNAITFGGGYEADGKADDGFCIPYYIYGIKGA